MALLAGIAFAHPAFCVYSPYSLYHAETFTGITAANWRQNGTLSASPAGLVSTGTGSLLSLVPSGDGSSEYEVLTKLKLTVSGGTYTTYIRASDDALQGSPASGTWYSVQLENPTFTGASCAATLAAYQRIGGVTTMLTSFSVGCGDGMTVRVVRNVNGFAAYVNEVYTGYFPSTAIGAGRAGVGVSSVPAGNGLQQVEIRSADRVAPGTLPATEIRSVAHSDSVDLTWPGIMDAWPGSSLYGYWIYRNNQFYKILTQPVITDKAVSPSTDYTYTIYPVDRFYNVGVPIQVTVRTPSE